MARRAMARLMVASGEVGVAACGVAAEGDGLVSDKSLLLFFHTLVSVVVTCEQVPVTHFYVTAAFREHSCNRTFTAAFHLIGDPLRGLVLCTLT